MFLHKKTVNNKDLLRNKLKKADFYICIVFLTGKRSVINNTVFKFCTKILCVNMNKLFYKKIKLKGQCHEIFCFLCFDESVSRKSLIIPLGPFRIFRYRRQICRRCRWHRWQINLSLVSLIPVVHLDLRISPRIFEKIWNGLNGILWGWGGNWFMEKTRSKKSRDTVPLTKHQRKHEAFISGKKLCADFLFLIHFTLALKWISSVWMH